MADENTNTTEEWRPVSGYEGIYEVNPSGLVRRVLPASGATVGKVLKPQSNGLGYLHVCLANKGDKARRYVHRIVATAFLGPPPDGHEVNHKDGNKSNNEIANLEYVTHAANLEHARDTGLRRKRTTPAKTPTGRKWVHRLSNVDVITKTATCAACGLVHIRIKDKGRRPTCAIAEAKWSGAARRKRARQNYQDRCR